MKYLFRLFVIVCLFGNVGAYANLAEGTVSCTSTTSSGNEFVPSYGKIIIDEDSFSRYYIQYMYWDNYERLLWLNTLGSSTFEPDVTFYDYDGEAYGGEQFNYWTSNLPSPYVDTPFIDQDGEKVITIGSAEAVKITHGKVYHTITRMTDGGGSSSWVKLIAQRGRQYPTGCFSTWCSFGCEDEDEDNSLNNFFTLPFQDHFEAPGCQRYNWLWNITSRRDC